MSETPLPARLSYSNKLFQNSDSMTSGSVGRLALKRSGRFVAKVEQAESGF
jgi:hypothetical protein